MQKTPIACIPEFDIQRRPDVMDLGGGTRSRSRSPHRGEGQSERASKQRSRSSSPRGSRREGSSHRRSPSPRGKERGERDERYKQEQKERAEQKKIWELFLYSQYTICGTYKRVSSWGGFFSGKMMEYLFGQYFQLPTFFKYFANILQVCHQYCTTAPIYNYNNASPYCFLEIPAHFSFIDRFVHHFGADVASFSGSVPYLPPIVRADGSRASQVLADRPYIQTWLTLHTLQIRICSELFMAPFMDADIDDAESFSEHASSLSSRDSYSSTESWVNDIKENADSYPYPALTWLTLGPLEASVEGDGSFRTAMSSNGSRGSRGSRGNQGMGVGMAPEGGGGGKMKHLLPVSYTKKNRKNKYIKKNNNKNKTHHNKKYSLSRHRFKKNKTGKTNRTNKTFRKKYRH